MNKVAKDGPIKVPIKALDELAPGDEEIALLKVDVEGYEKFVFVGAQEILKRVKCITYESCENFYKEYGYHKEDVSQLLRQEGFVIFSFNDNIITPVSDDHNLDGCETLLAIRDINDFLARTSMTLAKSSR